MNWFKRVALFSDVHGNISGVRAVLAAIDRLGGADLLVAAGDTVGGSSGTDDLLALLAERKVVLIRGNSEELLADPGGRIHKITPRFKTYAEASTVWLKANLTSDHLNTVADLPLTLRFGLGESTSVLVCHAAPNDPWARINGPQADLQAVQSHLIRPDADLVCYGHWHDSFAMSLSGKTLINVASVGLRTDGLAAFTILESEGHRVTVYQRHVPYDAVEEARLNREREVPLVSDYIQTSETQMAPHPPVHP